MSDRPGVVCHAGLGPDVAAFEETDKTFMAEDMGFLQGEQPWLHCIAGLGPDVVKYQDIDRTFVAEDMGFLQGEQQIGLQIAHVLSALFACSCLACHSPRLAVKALKGVPSASTTCLLERRARMSAAEHLHLEQPTASCQWAYVVLGHSRAVQSPCHVNPVLQLGSCTWQRPCQPCTAAVGLASMQRVTALRMWCLAAGSSGL